MLLIDHGWSLVMSAISKYESSIKKTFFYRHSLYIVGSYLNESTVCVFWNEKFDFQLQHIEHYTSFVVINLKSLNETLGLDVMNARIKKNQLQETDVDELILKITISIEVTHCQVKCKDFFVI